MDKEMSKEEMVKEALEEAKKAAEQADNEAEASCDTQEETDEKEAETCECEAEEEESTEDAEASEETAASEKESKKLFKRKNKKDKKDEKIEELTDKLTRQMAEFDNYRKRTEKEKTQMYEIGARDVVEKILPVIDNFERGLAAVTEEQKADPFVEGVDKVYKQMFTTLEEIGVKPIEAVGNEFNPDLHNAVMHIEDESLGENVVAEEFQKGYRYRETVVRHSMVKVAN